MVAQNLAARRAFVFDLDDTLVDWRAAERGAFRHTVETHLAPAGIDLETAELRYSEVLRENFQAFQATGKWWYARDRLARLVELLGQQEHHEVAELEATFRGAVDRGLSFMPGALELLGALRLGGYRVALLTNGPVPFQRDKVDRLAISHHFHHVGISGEMGVWKPEPDAFHRVLGALGVGPEEAVMVGDSMHFDLEPAARLGMATVWVTGAHGHARDWAQGPTAGTRPDLEVVNPAQLHRHLGLPTP